MFEKTMARMAKTISLRPKVTPRFKYGINHQIGLLPHKRDLIQQLISHLAKEGISRNEFYTDRAIPMGSTKSIPADRLLKYAQVFDCTIDDLLNDKVSAKSFLSLASSRTKSALR